MMKMLGNPAKHPREGDQVIKTVR